jgi:hypothetical protein
MIRSAAGMAMVVGAALAGCGGGSQPPTTITQPSGEVLSVSATTRSTTDGAPATTAVACTSVRTGSSNLGDDVCVALDDDGKSGQGLAWLGGRPEDDVTFFVPVPTGADRAVFRSSGGREQRGHISTVRGSVRLRLGVVAIRRGDLPGRIIMYDRGDRPLLQSVLFTADKCVSTRLSNAGCTSTFDLTPPR